MSANAPSHFTKQYATAIEMLVQQKVSRFGACVRVGSHTGNQASPVDQIGAIAMQPVTNRFGAINRVDAPLDRRWVFPADFDLAQLVDPGDELRMIIDPKGPYVQNAAMAVERQKDDKIIAAMFADAKTGVEGATTTTFLAGNVVEENFGAASDVGLTVAKVRRGKKILMGYEVDVESDPIYMAASAAQLDNLLAEAQVISLDYNDHPVLVDGKITRFLGVNFIHTERLSTNSDSDRLCPMWAKSGVYLGMWGSIRTDIDRRKDLTNHPWQAYLAMTIGATRLEEKKVIQIQCTEA